MLSVLFANLLTKETDLPINYFDGLSRVCKIDKYAFMAMDNIAAELQPKLTCSLESLDTITQTTIAMAVPNRSPYDGIINAKYEIFCNFYFLSVFLIFFLGGKMSFSKRFCF